MAAAKIRGDELTVKIKTCHRLVLNPDGVIAYGTYQKSGLLSVNGWIVEHDKSTRLDDGKWVTIGVPLRCWALMWVEAINESRSGLLVAITDLESMGGDGCRLVVAVPPYKKRINFKSEQEMLTYMNLDQVKSLKEILPPEGAKDLQGLIKSVSTPIVCQSPTHMLVSPVQLNMYKVVHLTNPSAIDLWHKQEGSSKATLLAQIWEDAKNLAITSRAQG